MQSQLARLHEKYGQEALKAEQLETLNKDSKINLENLISENAALNKTIEKLEYENRRLNENFSVEKNNLKDISKSEITNKPAYVTTLGFHCTLPAKGCTATRSSENIKVLPEISGNFELMVGRETDMCPISLTLKSDKMISCKFAATITFYKNKQATPVLTCET